MRDALSSCDKAYVTLSAQISRTNGRRLMSNNLFQIKERKRVIGASMKALLKPNAMKRDYIECGA